MFAFYPFLMPAQVAALSYMTGTTMMMTAIGMNAAILRGMAGPLQLHQHHATPV